MPSVQILLSPSPLFPLVSPTPYSPQLSLHLSPANQHQRHITFRPSQNPLPTIFNHHFICHHHYKNHYKPSSYSQTIITIIVVSDHIKSPCHGLQQLTPSDHLKNPLATIFNQHFIHHHHYKNHHKPSSYSQTSSCRSLRPFQKPLP